MKSLVERKGKKAWTLRRILAMFRDLTRGNRSQILTPWRALENAVNWLPMTSAVRAYRSVEGAGGAFVIELGMIYMGSPGSVRWAANPSHSVGRAEAVSS
jgi:hypothetical protein